MSGTDQIHKLDYETSQKKLKTLSDKWLKTLPEKGRYLVNHTKQVCLDLQAEKGEGETWGDGKTLIVIHPLPLLTCSGNGRGGGDYHDGEHMELVES